MLVILTCINALREKKKEENGAERQSEPIKDYKSNMSLRIF